MAALLKNIAMLLMLATFCGCLRERPTEPDGTSQMKIVVLFDSSSAPGVQKFIPVANGKIILSSEYGVFIRYTNQSGVALCQNLPASRYAFSVRGVHPSDPAVSLTGVKELVDLTITSAAVETVYVTPIAGSGLVINELYVSGPVNSLFYFFDQFIELYNASDSVKYVDGMMVMRVSGNSAASQMGSGADEDGDGDIDGVSYVYRFPGMPGEMNHPIQPKQFMVLASKAVDHRKTVSASVDLSHADFEFRNQFSTTDIDNPNVPDLRNMRPDNTSAFLINLVSDVVVLSSGRDSVWSDGIDISTIVDGVEYQSSPPPDNKKTLDQRVDKGYVLSPPRYSGQSMQRKEPGFDSNNGTVDFEIIPRATPGYQ